MAGAGYKLFQTGDVLTAAQVNTYLNEQTVMVFANAAARTSALTSVLAEGMVSYLQDTNAVEVYNGSAWVGVSGAGDITEVQAGVGISVASGTGPIPVITNSSTDLITTAGDLLYGTAADTVARLGIGTAGQVLKVNSGATAPEWGAAAGGITWEAWTPVYSAWTIGNATVTSLKASSGDMRFFFLRVVWGSTTTFTGVYPAFELPYAATYKNTAFFGDIYDASGGTFTLKGQTGTADNNCYLTVENASGTYVGASDFSNTVPMTWTTNDKIIITGAYPV
jgi:hypothetical protein